MFSQLLPLRVDNNYRGHKLALWLFGVVLFLRLLMSLNAIFNGYDIATNADGIPLGTYPLAAAQTLLSLFAILGLSNFIICLICIAVLTRYRSLIPFMFTLLLLDQLSRRLIFRVLPIVRVGTPPGIYINLALLILMIAGLTFSLLTPRRAMVAA